MSCWLTRGEEVLENELAIGLEEMVRITGALEELSQRELPKVRIEEAGCESGGSSTLKVEWAYLNQYKQRIGDRFLSLYAQRKLFEQSLYVQAAKRHLVTVERDSSEHELTVEEMRLATSFNRILLNEDRRSYGLDLGPEGLWSHPEEWVQEDSMLLFEFPPDEFLPFGSTNFYRFVAKDALTLEHLSYIQEFLFQAEAGPFDEYSVPVTAQVELIAHALGFISTL